MTATGATRRQGWSVPRPMLSKPCSMGVVMTAGNRRKVQTGTLTKDGHEVLRGCAGLLERAWHAKGRGGRGLIEMETAIGHHTVPVATVAWLVLSLLAGAGMGAIRAVTVTIWRAEDGSAWRHGTKFTAALWLVSLAAHFRAGRPCRALHPDPLGDLQHPLVPGGDHRGAEGDRPLARRTADTACSGQPSRGTALILPCPART